MRMYHADSKDSIVVHPSQIENAKRSGWTPSPINEKAVKVKIKKTDGGHDGTDI